MIAPPRRSTGQPLVLIANDQEWTARSLETILAAEGYQVSRAYTGRQALERALAERPDLIILDRQLPDLDGPTVCRELRDSEAIGPLVPIVITTAGPAGRTQRLEAYDAGAWEFFGQPLDGELVGMQLRTFLAAKRLADRVHEEALVDEPTGLYNARGLERRAREVGSEASRLRQPLACVVFGAVNNGLAEAVASADALAHQLGATFLQQGREADIYGRLGGLQFGVVAPATTADGARRLIERLSTAAREALRQDGTPPVELRAGYCAVSDYGAGEMDVTEMLQRAGVAMQHDAVEDLLPGS